MKTKIKKLFVMNTYLRLGIIVAIFILLIVMSILLYKTVNSHRVVTEKVSLYSYRNKANINYKVFLLPNEIYTENSLAQGNTYITDYIDYINPSFIYEFTGERTADIKGNYEIVAVVEGMLGNEKGNKTVWKKETILQEKTDFNVNDKKYSIQKDIPIKLKGYSDFSEKVAKSSNVNFNTKFTIFFRVNLEAKTDKGVIKESLSPSMEIPLNSKSFEIKGDLSQGKEAAIEEEKSTAVSTNKKIVAITSSIICIGIAMLLFLFFFTSGVIVSNVFKKKLNQIFKLHGSRMVAIESEVSFSCESIMKVVSIEDLVRISDDTCKPILYRHSGDIKEIYKFYVMDEGKIYLFELVEKLLSNVDLEKNSVNLPCQS